MKSTIALFLAVVTLGLGSSAALAQTPVGEPAPGQRLTLSQGYSLDEGEIEFIKAAVLDDLVNPDSARFDNIRALGDTYGNISVCGMVNSRDAAGRMTGMTPFTGSLVNPPTRNTDGSREDRPADGFELIAIGGEACPRCLDFGARSVPSIACWATGRNAEGVPSPQQRVDIPTPGSLLGQ
jgi:hypothetical protein